MALNQMYAVTGRKPNPNIVDIINSQTPYLLGLKQQEKQDDLTKQWLALQEQEMMTNKQLAREQMEEQKKQAKRGNLMSLANLGLKGGMGLYGYSEPVRNVVDKTLGGVGKAASGAWDTLMGSAPSTESLYGGAMGLDGFDWGSWGGTLAETAGELIKPLASGLFSETVTSTPYEGIIGDLTDWLDDIFGG